jgi:hypothetical protein
VRTSVHEDDELLNSAASCFDPQLHVHDHAGLWGSLHTLAPLLIFFAADALYPRLKGRAALLVYLAHARSQHKVGSKAARIIDAVSPISSS